MEISRYVYMCILAIAYSNFYIHTSLIPGVLMTHLDIVNSFNLFFFLMKVLIQNSRIV